MKLYCAPMEGVTGYLYRQAHHRYFPGVDRYYMPFLSPSQEHAFTRKAFQDLLPEHNEGLDAVPQLLTRRCEDFIWAAGELQAMGYREVNLNLGCPSGTVTAKGKGAGFLAFPEELDRFLDAVFSAVEIGISVKTRLGVRSEEEFPALLAIFDRYPISELIIHPRVRTDFYQNEVHIRAFQQALRHSKNPVCYNGDLVTCEDCAAFSAHFPQVDAVMLGRGLIADPALAAKAKGGAPADKARLRAFHDELFEGYAAAFGSRRNAMMRMKELWCYLIHLFEGGEPCLKRLRKAADPADYESQVRRIFSELALRADARPGWRG